MFHILNELDKCVNALKMKKINKYFLQYILCECEVEKQREQFLFRGFKKIYKKNVTYFEDLCNG